MATRTKIHTVYKNKAGKRLPSVTTVLQVLAKEALINWAWKCGLAGEDYKAVRDDAGNVGTLAHYLILCHLKREKPDLSEWPPDQIDRAENSLIKYWDWEKEHPIVPILVEEPLISERYGFGGTIDCLAKLDGKPVLIDHKTGKAIYAEMIYQLAGYQALLQENGYEVSNCRILRIGREDTGDFEERIAPDLSKHWQIFLNCLSIYQLQKEAK